MPRRILALFAFAAATAAPFILPSAVGAAERPNIIYIMADDN